MVTFNSLVHALRVSLDASGIDARHGHIQQLLAAALGHNTLASLQSAGDADRLPEAHHVIVDVDLLRRRSAELGFDKQVAALVEAVVKVFREGYHPSAYLEGVHLNPTEFIQTLQQRMDYLVVNDSPVVGEMAMTNGGLDEIYLPLELWDTFDVDDVESIDTQVVGHVTAEKDPPGDKAYYGHHIDVALDLSVERLGRRLFGELVLDVTHAKLRWMDEEPA